jgi:signal transduction histidine kinase
VHDARDLTVAEEQSGVAGVLSEGLFTRDAGALADVDAVVRDRVLSDRVVRVKIWAPDGTILYSDQAALIGQRFPLGDEERKALDGGAAKAEVSNLQAPENVFERQYDKLLEVYDGVHTTSGRPVLYEAYLRFASVSADSHRTLISMLPALVLGLALLFLIQIPLAWSLARSVERSREEEKRLLRRALDAGDIERRHIAADLHDGVVQSLAGTSLSLAAAASEAERAGLPLVAEKVGQAAGELRQGVRDLRSLIVAIAPPRLHDEGLAAALGDLVSPLAARGVTAEVHVDDDLPLSPATESLLYRTAQEAVRNVTRHARAARVEIDVANAGGIVRLCVADDGIGFTPETMSERQAGGHVGLRLLSELAGEAGGRLDVEAAPGAGTRVRLEVPVA